MSRLQVVMVSRQTTGPNHTNVACNPIGRRFNKARNRCNSNATISWFEIVAGELHATLIAGTAQRLRAKCAWSSNAQRTPRATSVEGADGPAGPGRASSRRAERSSQRGRRAGGRARRRPEHRWRSQQEHRWRSQQEHRWRRLGLIDKRLGPGTCERYRARSQTPCQSSDTGVTP